MSTGSEIRTAGGFEDLSALVDGELPDDDVASACGRWRNDAESRSSWYAYQLIGDVLRSEDLAADAGRDAAFLGSLRARLATEPVVLAPQRSPAASDESTPGVSAARGSHWPWKAASAVAAGFLAVAGVLTVLRAPIPEPVSLAAGSLAAVATANASSAVAAIPIVEAPLVANGEMLRDAGLDRYLSAHKRFAGSSALGVPSQFLRSATVDASGR